MELTTTKAIFLKTSGRVSHFQRFHPFGVPTLLGVDCCHRMHPRVRIRKMWPCWVISSGRGTTTAIRHCRKNIRLVRKSYRLWAWSAALYLGRR